MNKRIALLSAAILTFGVGTLYLGITMKNSRPPKDPNSWDIIIFTQTWPNSLCYLWKGKNANHTCNFPPQKDLWTVHGLWPTKYGTIGPSFCNSSSKFDPDAIYGLKDKLNQYWTDLLKLSPINSTVTNSSSTNTSHKKESFYFHEWEKHGTCASTLPSLSTEFKYFNQGIEWSEKYNMKDILEKSGIKVNSTLNVSDYWKAVKSNLKINAWVQCEIKHDTKEQMLDEIRICFDKSLNLIDCDGIMKPSRRGSTKTAHLLTNCDLKKPILYLDYVPEHNTSSVSNTTNLNSTNSNSTNNDKEWDVIVFSQTWPYTFCHTWTEHSSSHTCNLPSNQKQWTIHGVWPSKTGSFGPFFCNNQTSFNLNELDTIIPELHDRWTEIKGLNKHEGGLWKHEWNKHGKCSLSLPTLDSELKYFKQGLDWSKQYNLSELLAQGGINPNGAYPIKQFWYTLTAGLGKNPRIECFIEKDSNKVYIKEVRLCFDKSLSLVDCDYYKKDGNTSQKPYTNCPEEKEIYYLDTQF